MIGYVLVSMTIGWWVLIALSIVTWRLRWAVFVATESLPRILLEQHKDWFVLLQWIPRRWFAWLGKPPVKAFGNATGNLDITAPGTWALCWPLFFTIRLRNGLHWRVGLRRDYSDHYYQLSTTIPKKPK